jgi:hypothetical protein
VLNENEAGSDAQRDVIPLTPSNGPGTKSRWQLLSRHLGCGKSNAT